MDPSLDFDSDDCPCRRDARALPPATSLGDVLVLEPAEDEGETYVPV